VVRDENIARGAELADKYQSYHQALTELVGYLDSGNIKAFLDQPTQCFQDRYLAAEQAFAHFGTRASQGYLDSVDERLTVFRGVGTAIVPFQNAALVEEAAAAAASLHSQTQHLTDAVAVFKLAGV